MADTGNIVCENCCREIAASNYTVHVSHCRRHLAVCDLCGETVPKTEMEQHRTSLHSRVPCRLCGEQVFSGLLQKHEDEVCPGRSVICPYCDLSMPFSSLEEHESYCGSRTELCPTCDVRVMYKYWPLHVESGHTLTRPERPRSPPKDDCFEQAMLMAIELSKKSAEGTPAEPVNCHFCQRSFSPEVIERHEESCSLKAASPKLKPLPGLPLRPSLKNTTSTSTSTEPSEPRWAPRPVQTEAETQENGDNEFTLPCEFCENAFTDDDLLRHQLRCEKNPQRLDLPERRTPKLPSSSPIPSADRKSYTQLDGADRKSYSHLDGADYYRRHSAALESNWRDRVAKDLQRDEALSRRWSTLNIEEHPPPEKPHRSKKHKKRVNFVTQDEVISPETEGLPEVKPEKKKKKHKDKEHKHKEHKEHKKKSSKKHRAPEPPGDVPPPENLQVTCNY